MNPDVRADGLEKTDEELAIQARSLDLLGAALASSGVTLAVHAHDKEMRSGAREWHHILRHTDPAKVGICLDLHWVLRGRQNPLALLSVARGRVRDLHLRNSRAGVWLQDLGPGALYRASPGPRQQRYQGTLRWSSPTTAGPRVPAPLRRTCTEPDVVPASSGLTRDTEPCPSSHFSGSTASSSGSIERTGE